MVGRRAMRRIVPRDHFFGDKKKNWKDGVPRRKGEAKLLYPKDYVLVNESDDLEYERIDRSLGNLVMRFGVDSEYSVRGHLFDTCGGNERIVRGSGSASVPSVIITDVCGNVFAEGESLDKMVAERYCYFDETDSIAKDSDGEMSGISAFLYSCRLVSEHNKRMAD